MLWTLSDLPWLRSGSTAGRKKRRTAAARSGEDDWDGRAESELRRLGHGANALHVGGADGR